MVPLEVLQNKQEEVRDTHCDDQPVAVLLRLKLDLLLLAEELLECLCFPDFSDDRPVSRVRCQTVSLECEQFEAACPLTMQIHSLRTLCLLRIIIGARCEQHSQSADDDHLRNRVISRHVASVEQLDGML